MDLSQTFINFGDASHQNICIIRLIIVLAENIITQNFTVQRLLFPRISIQNCLTTIRLKGISQLGGEEIKSLSFLLG